jgi:DNA polymerase III delta prime subunit
MTRKELKEKYKKMTIEEKQKYLIKESTNSVNYDDIVAKKTEFIITPYIPQGKIVIFMGDPGSSKSSYALKIASAISNGGLAPFTGEKLEQSNVVIQNIEDGIEDTLKPRLEAFGANFNFIKTINEEGKDINDKSKKLFLDDHTRIKNILKRYKPSLFIVDPIQSYLKKTDLRDASKIRTTLGPIAQLANQYNCTFIFVMHLNKGDSKSLYRGLGSIDFIGIARAVLLIGKNPNDNEEIIVEHIKYNLSKQGETFAYKIVGNDKGIKDLEFLGNKGFFSFDSYRTQDSSLKDKPIEFAKLFLRIELADSPIGATEIISKAKMYDISETTLNRAKSALGIKSKQENQKHYWYMPNCDNLNI